MKRRTRVGLIDLGVHSYRPSLDLLQPFIDVYERHNPHRCESRFTQHHYKLSGNKRSVNVAASFVWRYKKLVYICRKDRLPELMDAIHVAVRCGRKFEVYVLDASVGLSSLQQVDFTLRRHS